jgi:hypothetical protein
LELQVQGLDGIVGCIGENIGPLPTIIYRQRVIVFELETQGCEIKGYHHLVTFQAGGIRLIEALSTLSKEGNGVGLTDPSRDGELYRNRQWGIGFEKALVDYEYLRPVELGPEGDFQVRESGAFGCLGLGMREPG